METADVLTMILFGLIVAACWVTVPGLIAGWLLRESGRSFKWGFALGALCGPLGILLALVFVAFADRRDRYAAHSSSGRRGARTHYEVPIFGRLHASTASTLAGLATFMCVWLLGGIGYEVFYNLPREAEQRRAAGGKPKASAQPVASPDSPQPGDALAAGKTAAVAKGEAQSSQSAPMIGAVTSQPPQPGQLAASASPVAMLPNQAASLEGVELTGVAPSPQPSAPPQTSAPIQTATVPAATPNPPSYGRAAIISELTGSLGARGYKAHATVSGDARTSTLSISCATLTRAAGNQLLGSSRTRQALKSAGIRIVVMVNGQESWTYML